jgi:fluoride exporter
MQPRLAELSWVFLGGGLGALSRHLMLLMIPPLAATGGRLQEALGILVVNALGCLLLGAFVCLSERFVSLAPLRPFVVVGFLGGLTTYSSFQLCWLKLFSEEGLRLWPVGYPLSVAVVQLLGYPLLSLAGGWLSFGIGYLGTKALR